MLITSRGQEIDFHDTGEGPAVLFVPGSFSTHRSWSAIQDQLPQQYRFISTSICGYGNTKDPRTLDDFDMQHEVDVLKAVRSEIGAPLHLVGHSFGATIALASVMDDATNILSLTTFEANPLTMLETTGQSHLFQCVHDVASRFEAAHFAGMPDAAGLIIDFWGGEGSFKAMPEAVQAYCRTTARANVLDWRTVFTFAPPLTEYAQLTVPAMLVRGSLANLAMNKITAGLESYLPNSRTQVVEGAGHFLNTSHPHACGDILTSFLQENFYR